MVKKILMCAALLLCLSAYSGEFENSRTFVLGVVTTNGNVHARMKLSNGKIVLADAADEDVGTLQSYGAADTPVAIKLPKLGQTYLMLSAGAITLGNDVYPAADGKVSATVSGARIGIALTTVTAANKNVEVLRLPPKTIAPTSVFLSDEQTGNGSAQSVAHGLGQVPTLVIAIPSDLSGGAFVVAYGTHTTTNAVLTVTNGEKYRVLAIK